MCAVSRKEKSPFVPLLSNKLGDMQARIDVYKQKYQELWLDTPVTFPEFEKSYARKEKRELEQTASALLQQIGEIEKNNNLDKETMLAYGDEIIQLCGQAGLHFDRSFSDGFGRASREFLRMARAFDAQLQPEEIYQALRNVWIANSLQVLMGQEMHCSAPLFAYSMLYPYSDNIIDDPELSFSDKLNMNVHFKKWLQGETCPAANGTEEKIHALVELIEKEFPRDCYPRVFQGLLAIFNGQIKSLMQQKQHTGLEAIDLLDISLEKGGTSVLADGYLLGGTLDDRWEDFCFGYGAFLQFADDLQDVADDLGNGHQTLYSLAAAKGPLDAQANRLLHFMRRVVDEHLAGPDFQGCREMIVKNCLFMVQEAILKTAPFYSADYLRAMERHFPISFPFYRQVKNHLKQMLFSRAAELVKMEIKPLC